MMKRLSTAGIASVVLTLLGAGTLTSPAQAKPLELKWDSTGYFRTRGIALTNLAPQNTYQAVHVGNVLYDVPEILRTSYITSRLRITPTLSWGNAATLNFQIDALDDVLWGDNNGLSSAPLFSTDPTDQHFLDGTRDALVLHKAWVQFNVPVGVMRVGRMPSHWGLGLLANGGGNANMDLDPERPKHIEQRKHIDTYFDDDYGDNHFGTVADRVLFLTKPLSIFKTIAKKQDTSSKLVVGYAYDKISEAPFLRAEPAGALVRPSGQQGYLSRPGDDINQHVAFAVWNDPYAKFGGPLARDSDELRLGTYFVWRKSDRGSTQPSTTTVAEDEGSDIFIADFWGRFRYGPLYAETEVLAIVGDTFGGVPFPSKNTKKEAMIHGGAARFGYFAENSAGKPSFEAIMELGHASGDDDPTDEKFQQRSLHPDHNVGLILFEETLRELSARTYGPPFVSSENPNGAEGFFSNGGVINANYLHPKVRYHLPGKKVTIVSSVLMAWVDKLAIAGPSMFFEPEPGDPDTGSYLGTEVDLAIKAQFSGKMHFSLETGYLHFGGALKSVLPNKDGSFTLQSRIAFLW
jgi:hypothetical protein